MRKKILIVFLILQAIVFIQAAGAESLSDLQLSIQQACIRSGNLKSAHKRNLKEMCQCIAKSHGDSASVEAPNKGLANLRWILKLYTVRTDAAILAHAKSNVGLFDYDVEVAQTCQLEVLHL